MVCALQAGPLDLKFTIISRARLKIKVKILKIHFSFVVQGQGHEGQGEDRKGQGQGHRVKVKVVVDVFYPKASGEIFFDPPTHLNLHLVQIGKNMCKNGPPLGMQKWTTPWLFIYPGRLEAHPFL